MYAVDKAEMKKMNVNFDLDPSDIKSRMSSNGKHNIRSHDCMLSNVCLSTLFVLLWSPNVWVSINLYAGQNTLCYVALIRSSR